ncbi:chloride channel protein [Desulfobacter postgatei]|jgi:CIC family chloride channel protein|uniref:chloride channel protein n=1 Tax=Desulfobacter postgatei TaxID=2293 RepID=UPI002A35C1D6|nr:chloride channel protein [Desulfobacter postgatei]MDX9964188.1 chloride channel protein [Desulfobacter postgatei]
MRTIKQLYNIFYAKFFLFDDRLVLMTAGAIVGIFAGLAAVALRLSLASVLEYLAPYRQYAWAFILPGIGAMLSFLFLDKVVREGAGHGVPEVIYAVSRRGGLLRLRSTFSRLISSFLTIASGGSAGPEAPVVMSGSAIGSNIAKFLDLNDRQRMTLVGCGTAGAIASIFHAPVAGLIFSVEIILGEWKFVNIIPITIAAVAGAQISEAIIPAKELFQHHPFSFFTGDILGSIGLALFTALISVIFTWTLTKVGALAKRTPVSPWLRAMIGGCTVGTIGIFMPMVLGEGYHPIMEMVSSTFPMTFWLVFIGLFLKIFVTSMTLGWGGSGGIFAPCLVIGSLTGVVFHKAMIFVFPNAAVTSEGAYALLGMTGIMAGVMQAPLTSIFLIAEITGGYEAVLLLLLVSSISSTLSYIIEPSSFYFKDLIERGEFMRPGTDARILSDLSLNEIIDTNYTPVSENMVFRAFIDIIRNSDRDHYPVISDETGNYIGMVRVSSIRKYALDPAFYDMIFLNQIMDRDMVTASFDDNLHDVLEFMETFNIDHIPVVDHHKFCGMISKARILDLYRRELIMQTNIQ